MKPTLQANINQINGALANLGLKKAYDIGWPKYNRYGFNFQRIAECSIASGLADPKDVPCWDKWTEDYRVTELFWTLWKWDQNNYGTPERELEDLLDNALNLPLTLTHERPTVMGQAAALRKLKE